MATVKRFEELEAWKDARQLTRDIYEIGDQGSLRRDRGLRDQIQRASLSVMSNIAEGFGYRSDKQFVRFLDTARGSGYEVQSLLYVILDVHNLDEATFDRLYNLADDAISKVAGLQRYLRKSLE